MELANLVEQLRLVAGETDVAGNTTGIGAMMRGAILITDAPTVVGGAMEPSSVERRREKTIATITGNITPGGSKHLQNVEINL